MLNGLPQLEELLFLFDSNFEDQSLLWLEREITAPLVDALEKQTSLRTLVLSNGKLSDRLLNPTPVRLQGGSELLAACSGIENLGLSGVSPTSDSFSTSWKLQLSFATLLPNLKSLDCNVPLSVKYTQMFVHRRSPAHAQPSFPVVLASRTASSRNEACSAHQRSPTLLGNCPGAFLAKR